MFVRKSEYTIIRETPEGAFLVNVENGEECVLNEAGCAFVQALDGSVQEVKNLAECMVELFDDVSIEDLSADMIDLYSELSLKQLVYISDNKQNIEKYQLRGLHIDITMKCNERCLHCYIPNDTKDDAETMPYEQFCRLVDEFVLIGGEYVTLSGGEPLTHSSFLEILKYCREKDVTVLLLSNLLLLSDEIVEVLKTMKVQVVQTSIYSLRPAIHDKITRVHGSLSKTIKAVESLLKAGIKVQVSCPIMNINKDEVPDLINFCKKRNIRLKTNALLIPQDNGNREFVDTSRLTLEQKECMLCGMMECDLHYTKNNLLQISNHSESFYQNPKDFLKSTVCGIVEESLCVSSNGDVYPCEGWKKYKLGNIFEESLNDIWRYSDDIRMLRQINKQRNFNKCLECKAIDYCKRCFVDVNDENEGELLRINPRVCKEAFLVKSIIERYNIK